MPSSPAIAQLRAKMRAGGDVGRRRRRGPSAPLNRACHKPAAPRGRPKLRDGSMTEARERASVAEPVAHARHGERHPGACHGRRAGGQVGPSRHADGHGGRGDRAVPRALRFDPADPDWPNRDRFVLSAGHGSMLLYALLYLTGYPGMTSTRSSTSASSAPRPRAIPSTGTRPASRRRRGRWARASPTRSAWRSPSAC